MNRAELVKAIAAKVDMSQKNVALVLGAMEEAVYETIPTDKVTIMNGVTLSSDVRPERNGVNPQTGEKIVIPAHRVPKCKFGSAAKAAVAE